LVSRLVAVAGIAAYLVSKWDELSASIVKGFDDGTVTLKPLITAAMVLWEKLKKVGEALVGGATGGSMMQWAIDLAAKADRRGHERRLWSPVDDRDIHPLGRQGR
jgi:hypothetical protein